MHQGNIFTGGWRKTRLPERCGWWMRGIISTTQSGGMGRFSSPAGNLVAQSLAAHGSNPLAATLRGRRVSRIAVHPARQREGVGQQLIASALQYRPGLDYLSVSFGYTGELWRFWQRCGFVLVRMGNHREASSGCYTAMALLPMSDAGKQLAEREHYRLRRDAQARAVEWRNTSC